MTSRPALTIADQGGKASRLAGESLTEFAKIVYAAVRSIPRGCVMSYGRVAALAGNPRGARGVGFCLHRNPEPGVIPCHRVVFADGRLACAFAFGGEGVQRAMLEAEGVEFLPDGRVDMAKCGI